MTNAITSKSESLYETLKLIHKRYSHLASQNEIFQEQKKIERTLEAKAEISRWHKSFLQYTPLHFYRLGKEFVKGKKVLDLECSKGHGSFLLAEDAGSVIALDENERSIRYASCHFIKENLVFKKGSLLDQSREGQALFDVIIWFRSMSNITELEKQLPMIHRFLKEGGIFLVSLPNKRNDLSSLNYPLGYRSSLNEFKSLLNKYFEYTLMYGQKIYPSSNIFPLFNTSESSREYLVEKGEENFLFVSPERKEAEYFIAVASNQPLENVAADSYLIDASECRFKFKEAQIKSLEEELSDKESHIRNLEDEVRRKDIYIKDLEVTVEAKGKEISKLESNIESILKEKDRYIESLKEAIGNRDKYTQDLEATLEAKGKEILTLHSNVESVIKEKDRYIESLKEAMDSKDKYAKDLERNLESIIPEKDQYIESLKEAIGNRDKYTQDLEATLESKVNEILKLQNYIESMIKEKDQYIESLKEAMDSKDKYAKDLERNLESIIPEKDKYIESLLNALDGKAKEVADLNTSIAQKNEDIERLNSELNALKNMVIYRLLKKFRFVKM
jgi:SAM-dependent methyltransferase